MMRPKVDVPALNLLGYAGLVAAKISLPDSVESLGRRNSVSMLILALGLLLDRDLLLDLHSCLISDERRQLVAVERGLFEGNLGVGVH